MGSEVRRELSHLTSKSLENSCKFVFGCCCFHLKARSSYGCDMLDKLHPHLFVLLHHFHKKLWITYRVIFWQCNTAQSKKIFASLQRRLKNFVSFVDQRTPFRTKVLLDIAPSRELVRMNLTLEISEFGREITGVELMLLINGEKLEIVLHSDKWLTSTVLISQKTNLRLSEFSELYDTSNRKYLCSCPMTRCNSSMRKKPDNMTVELSMREYWNPAIK